MLDIGYEYYLVQLNALDGNFMTGTHFTTYSDAFVDWPYQMMDMTLSNNNEHIYFTWDMSDGLGPFAFIDVTIDLNSVDIF